MILHLCIPQRLIHFGDRLPKFVQLRLHRRLSFLPRRDFLRHCIKGFFQTFDALFLLYLVGLDAQQAGIQLCPPNLRLFQHRILASHLRLDRRTIIQRINNRVFGIFDRLV